jgi:hypothetical protein
MGGCDGNDDDDDDEAEEADERPRGVSVVDRRGLILGLRLVLVAWGGGGRIVVVVVVGGGGGGGAVRDPSDDSLGSGW